MKMAKNTKTSAWEKASQNGCDMSLLEENLRLTPSERLLAHSRALQTVLILRNAVEKKYAG